MIYFVYNHEAIYKASYKQVSLDIDTSINWYPN